MRKVKCDRMQAAREENLAAEAVGKRIGEVLVEMGLLTQEQVDQLLAEQRHLASPHRRHRPCPGLGDQERSHGGPGPSSRRASISTWVPSRIDPVAADLISEKDARRYSAIPVSFVDEHTLLVAMADPSNIVAIDDLRILTGFDIEPAIASGDDIVAMLGKMRRADEQIAEHLGVRGRR